MKITKKRWLTYAMDAVIIMVTIGAIGYGIAHRRGADTACQGTSSSHNLTLKDGAFSQPALSVKRCDSVTVTNLDPNDYLLNFGTHEHVIAYPGFDEQLQATNETITINMIATGSYRLHDHLRNRADIQLTVTP